MKRILFGVVLVLLVASIVGSAMSIVSDDPNKSNRPVTKIHGCQKITKPGTYVLSSNITDGGGTFASQSCIVIESSNVLLDGQGNHVNGFGISDTTGIAVTGNSGTVENVTVKNVNLREWNRGIYYHDADRGTIQNVKLSHNAYGISIENSTRTRVLDIQASHNLVGVFVGPTTTRTHLENESFQDNHLGGVISNASAGS